MKICPSCQYGNREGILFCEDCGQALSGVPSVATRQLDRQKDSVGGRPTAANTWGTARFIPNASLVIHIRDASEPLTLKPSEETMMGRADLASKSAPTVDLTPFGAQEKGVSRMHAVIKRTDESLLLADLGSVNGTYLNGQRLMADHPHVLRDGDEVRLGKLVMHVYFKVD
jgi:hypothetical protein